MKEGLETQGIDQLNELVDGLATTSTNFRKLVEAIINIRS